MSIKAYKYRIYANKTTTDKLQLTLDRCRELYNAALQERQEAYKYAGKSISYVQQANQLPEIKAIRDEYNGIHSQVLQDVLRRVDKAMQAFFCRVKNGEKPGYPRYQGRNRYDSFTYPQAGFSLTHDNRVSLSKIGSVKVKFHRSIEGKIKTCTIKREGNQWYVIFACKVEITPRSAYTDEMVGIDSGVLRFATLSTGDVIENPRFYRRAEKKLAALHQAVDRKKHGSHRRKKAITRLSKAYRKARNRRRDFLHKHSRTLVDTFDTLVFEDLQPAHMTRRPKPKQDENGTYLPNGASAKSGLNKSMLDAGWAEFVQYCVYKAEYAGRRVLFVFPNYTSQICSSCGAVVKKELSERWHSCECGCELDRDDNAAKNILALGRRVQASA